MLVESTNQVFFKAFTLCIPVGVHECHMRLGEQKSQLLLRWADLPPISDSQCPTSGCEKIERFSRVTAVPYRSDDVAILDAKISARIRYGNLAHVSDDCRQIEHCIPNCGQKAADRDMVTLNSL